MKKSFLSKNIELKVFTELVRYIFNTYINTYNNPQTPVKRPHNNTVL